MASQVLRKLGFKKGEPRESDARIRLQKELFQYTKCVENGFPHKPTAIAYDPKLQLVAIGTKNGLIRIFGAPGVEFSGQHSTEDVAVTRLIFLPEQGRVISLCSDNSLHLWEINVKSDGFSVLEQVKSFTMEANKQKTISTCTLTRDASKLLLGTVGSNVHFLDIKTFALAEEIVYRDVIMQNVSDDFKVDPGAVESVLQHPTSEDTFLIGFNRGLIVLWDQKEGNPEKTYNAAQTLDALAWHRDGTQFLSAHTDGSYITWSTTDSTKPKEQAVTPYGPFPCKGITKIEWKTAKPEAFMIFSGGMPNASFGERHTVTVMQGTNSHVIFDLSSNVVDFVVLNTSDSVESGDNLERDDPHTLLILAEEEVVAVDLQKDSWPTFRLPYLNSIHSTPITCSQHINNVPEQLWTKIVDAGESQFNNVATREWPIGGGSMSGVNNVSKDLILTGHEDGSVRFWDASSVSLKLLYHLKAGEIFEEHIAPEPGNEDEEWPPFRKVGTFDPYSDDPRMGIQKINLCTSSETLVLGGTAGQVIVYQFEREEREVEVKATEVNIVGDRDNFVWKGHSALTFKTGEIKFAAGFQPTAVMQLNPPAACTALAVHTEWQLCAAGTAHGFGVFDYTTKKEVATKCTLNPQDLTGTGESAMSRRKSFKKSLRQSFRRLRKRRSERRRAAQEAKAKEDDKEKKPEEQATTSAAETPAESAKEGEAAAAATEETPKTETEAETPAPATDAAVEAAATTPPASSIEVTEVKSVERQVEARKDAEEAMASMVRCLYFADTFLMNAQGHTPTLWAGTNAGTVYAYQITVPGNDKRESDGVQCVLAKEVQLKHRAPVIAICVFDRNAAPLPGAFEVGKQRAKAPDMTGAHQVLICSEEQVKLFALPTLKANNKMKLTAHEGTKIRRVGMINFRSKSDENYNENDLAFLTNAGELNVISVPQLRRQLKAECIREGNVTGIGSCVFASNGEGYYLTNPSEFVRFSLSARYVNKPKCEVELKEGMRPEPEPEPEPTEEKTEEAGAGDAPAEGAKPADDGVADTTAEIGNLTVDSANMTLDDIKVHVSEEPKTEENKPAASSDETPATTESTPAAESSEAAATETASGFNIDDDTKINITTATPNKIMEEPPQSDPSEHDSVENLEELKIDENELKITEENDTIAQPVEATPQTRTDPHSEPAQCQPQELNAETNIASEETVASVDETDHKHETNNDVQVLVNESKTEYKTLDVPETIQEEKISTVESTAVESVPEVEAVTAESVPQMESVAEEPVSEMETVNQETKVESNSEEFVPQTESVTEETKVESNSEECIPAGETIVEESIPEVESTNAESAPSTLEESKVEEVSPSVEEAIPGQIESNTPDISPEDANEEQNTDRTDEDIPAETEEVTLSENAEENNITNGSIETKEEKETEGILEDDTRNGTVENEKATDEAAANEGTNGNVEEGTEQIPQGETVPTKTISDVTGDESTDVTQKE